MIKRAAVNPNNLNGAAVLPFELRTLDFQAAMQDVYDFFFDVNTFLRARGLARLEETLRPANMSGLITDMLTSSLAKHSRVLVPNRYPNGHPDLLVSGMHSGDRAQASEQGVEVKTTRKPGGAVDMHGARKQTLSVFVYRTDSATEPVDDREPMRFTEVYVGSVAVDEYRRNARGELGTRTATLNREGIARFRKNWVYLDP